MIYIAHRGNVDGPGPAENTIAHAKKAMEEGFHVELDVHWFQGNFLLGHDEGLEPVDVDFLLTRDDDGHNMVWCHAKTIKTFRELLSFGVHCFMHDRDPVAFTSHGYLWTYPGEVLTDSSICVKPEGTSSPWHKAAGVCSDYVRSLRDSRP